MRNYLFLLEFKNAFLCFSFLSISIVFGIMLRADRKNWMEPYYGAMIGLTTFFFGSGLHQGFYWAWRHFGDGDGVWVTPVRLIFIISAGLLMAVGGACTVRNFSIARFGHKAWIGILLSAVVATFVLTLLTPR